MTWSASSDNAAIYCYYIYRNGERVGNTTKTEYIDNGLKSHTFYEYYIVACDTSGNLSEWSNILEASTDVDAFAPTQPANLAAKIQSEGVVRLSWTASSDNGTAVRYNVYRNGTLIGSSNGTAFTDSTAFGGYYEYYVEAVDNEDNVSRASVSVFIDNLAPTAPVLTINSVKDDYIVTYDYRNCMLSAPVLSAEGAGWSVNLSWTMDNTEEIAGYYVYRRSSSSAKYSVIGSTTKNYATDYDVTAGQKYYYYVEAMDIRGNKVKGEAVSAVPTSEDTIAPIAYAGEGLFGIAGKAVSFDGTGSADNHYVASYKWDFGDGTTSTEARPKHTYSEAGTYKVYQLGAEIRCRRRNE